MAWRTRARGHLDPAWGDRLGGLRVAHEGGGSSPLAGPLPDQAALHGALLHLIRLGLPLLALDTGDAAPRPNDRQQRPPGRPLARVDPRRRVG